MIKIMGFRISGHRFVRMGRTDFGLCLKEILDVYDMLLYGES